MKEIRNKTPGDRSRFLPLFLTLVGMLLAHPVLMEMGYIGLLNLAWLGVLALALYCTGAVRRHTGHRWLWALLLSLGLPAVCLRAVSSLPFDLAPALRLLSSAVAPLFLTVVAVVVLRSVLTRGAVDSEKIYGAISVYLLLGLIWSSLYAVVELLLPGSFSAPSGAMLLADRGAEDVLPGSEAGFLYYSFVTLTTLGYGDITPVSPMAQTLSWMEAAAGQLFLAVTIARLVGLSIAAPDPMVGKRE